MKENVSGCFFSEHSVHGRINVFTLTVFYFANSVAYTLHVYVVA